MKFTTLMKKGVLIISIEGELDVHVADECRERFDRALDSSGSKNVVLNLKGVTFIDSSGLGVILGRYKRITALGGRIFAAHVQPQVTRVFEMSGITKIIKLYKSEAEALEQL